MLWVHRTIDAPAAAAWALLTDLDRWPSWGPSVAGASIDPPGAFVTGATGCVKTSIGPSLRFQLDEVVPGERWSWSVGGVTSTSHSVESVGDGRARIGFGVPVWAPVYLVVCESALRRIEQVLAVSG